MSAPEIHFDDERFPALVLTLSPLIVGRDPSADFVLEHETISKQHAEFREVDGDWSLVDLGSTNGTFVDGRTCAIPQPLSDGAKVRIGKVDARFMSHSVPAKTTPRVSTAGISTPPESAEERRDTEVHEPRESAPPELHFAGRPLQLQLEHSPIVVGRGSDCDVIIETPKMSKRHAQLTQEQGAWYVRDLESTNGTRVNDYASRLSVRLNHGDLIVFGDCSATFHDPAAMAFAEPASRPRSQSTPSLPPLEQPRTQPSADRGVSRPSVRAPARSGRRGEDRGMLVIKAICAVVIVATVGFVGSKALGVLDRMNQRERQDFSSSSQGSSTLPHDPLPPPGEPSLPSNSSATTHRIPQTPRSQPATPQPAQPEASVDDNLDDVHPDYRQRFKRDGRDQ